MKVLSACLALCALLAPGGAAPLNASTSVLRHAGLCDYVAERCSHLVGEYCPQCDAHGNFLPRQCWGSTGICWCVDVVTGDRIPGTETPPGTQPVDCEREYRCPYDWTYFGRRCFTFIDSPKTWVEAEIYCQFEGANLASVHSHEENHFVMALTRGYSHNFPQTWIGGFDAIQPGFWMWSDGSKFHYENWVDDINPVKNQSCLKMNYDYELRWSYSSCGDSLPFVCARRM